MTASPLGAKPKTELIAHRAASQGVPENTVAAILATARVAKYVELDVQMTKDGVAVVMHDDTVDRTTDGQGRVDALSFEEIRRLDAGKKSDVKFTGEKVPALHEALEAAKRAGVTALLDVKRCAPAAIVADVTKARAQRDVIVSSPDREFLRELNRLAPSLRLGYQGVTFLPDKEFRNHVSKLKEIGVRFVVWNEKGLPRGILRAYQSHRLKVFAWVSNDLGETVRLMVDGVDGILTDNPADIRNIQN